MGKAEPKTERINKRMAPILAYVMVMFLLIGIALAAYTDKHDGKDEASACIPKNLVVFSSGRMIAKGHEPRLEDLRQHLVIE
jgi:glucose uptake protein GlcU